MNKISKIVKNTIRKSNNNSVINFMGGISYEINPLNTLKMISASSIFGEPAYYRDGIREKSAYINKCVEPYALFCFDSEKNTSEIMIDAIKASLDYDFKGTIEWAKELRNNFYMRLNPQVIMVLASIHPKRKEFSKIHPLLFRKINLEVMKRADEPASQLAFYLYAFKSKKLIPSILKRSWAEKIESMNRYEFAKYKNAEIGLIDTVRICHAKGELVDELMKTGTIKTLDNEKTWENLKSDGKNWKEILETTYIPYMALLRNLCNIFVEIDNEDIADKIFKILIDGVQTSKQYPFRYYTALKKVEENSEINFKSKIIETLEKCLDTSIINMPKLKGKTACLSDNSGSAWGSVPSEYGSVKVAEIGNLSSVITCINSEEGSVFTFGDKLFEIAITNRNGALIQAKEVSKVGSDVGKGTENGIWLFFKNIIEKNIHYDNIFIYSDMQAGHGGLYGIGSDYVIDKCSYKLKNRYIYVMKLINTYRTKVNPKVNVFCIQTAGYNNVLIPEYIYRGAVLYGWTGKESVFADALIKQWDEIEKK